MPSATHVLYIPGVFVAGLILGFLLGARAAKSMLEKRERERRQ